MLFLLFFVFSIMPYTEKYHQLKEIFHLGPGHINIPGSEVRIYKRGFNSSDEIRHSIYNSIQKQPLDLYINDLEIAENKQFIYPVFRKEGSPKAGGAIILLHGLNEKKWSKYLAWADTLAGHTGKAVILFPISFHINRAPEDWSNPRKLKHLLENRMGTFRGIRHSTFVNLALSNRLTEMPERFFMSGYNSIEDLMELIRQIKSGSHPDFIKGATVDVFAYSIGVFLAQCLMIANPDHLLESSRFFYFCGGSLFSDMNGISKYILDSKAHERLHHFYVNELETRIKTRAPRYDVLRLTKFGQAFRSMITAERFGTFREKMVRSFQPNMYAITLKKDKVIPSEASIRNLFISSRAKKTQSEVLDPPYPYTHENPFPARMQMMHRHVDRQFDYVFQKAAEFLA